MKMRPNSALAVMALILGLGCTVQVHAADSISEVQQLVNKGQHAQALTVADRLLAANARDPQARFLKGIALTELNRIDEAIAMFQKLTEDFPELPEPYNNLAVLYAQQRQYDKARAALEMAIRTHPSYATAHENLGDVYARLASQAYDKALQLDSANAAAQSKLALIREMMSGSQSSSRTRVSGAQSPRPATVTAVAPAAAPTAAPQPPVAAKTPAPAAAASAATLPASPSPAPAQPASAPVASTPPAPAASAAAAPAASAARPAEKPAAEKPAAGPDEREALKLVETWAAAWSRKDVKSYLSYYDKDFRAPGGSSRKAWEQERERRVGKPGRIEVEVEDADARIDGDKATVRFRQHYSSAGFNSSTIKTLELVKRNGGWRILEERVGG